MYYTNVNDLPGGEQVTALQKNVGSNLDASTAHTTECVSAAREALVTNGSALQGVQGAHDLLSAYT